MGGAGAPLTPPESVHGIRRVLANLKPQDAGSFLSYDGSIIAW